MAFEERARAKPANSGPFIAEIVNHLDPLKMGRLEVAIKDGMQNSVSSPGETYIAMYASPFHGATSVRYEGTNSKDFNDVQKSYGFWMIPPDIGSKVLIIFANSDPNHCYWIGSVQDTYQNHMIPGLAASSSTNMTSQQQQKYGEVTYLPVAEYNKSTERLNDPNIDKKQKPIHPFADRLLAQGLLLDNIRGVTSSSARRETPSAVFGISTPGPLDPNGPKRPIGTKKTSLAPVSRLGGTTFVMDDGDVNGQNELVRIRTRTGHQILLHNSADLIYIGNAAGTAWLEMSSNGKIDIYAADSVSIHSENDFNFRADRDINIEAGRSLNLVSGSGDFNINALGNNKSLNIVANTINVNSQNNFNLVTVGDVIIAASGNYGLSVNSATNILYGSDVYQSSLATYNIISEGILALKSNIDISLSGVTSVSLSAPSLNLNGVPATEPPNPNTLDLTVATPLDYFTVPTKSPKSSWSNKYYSYNPITSIMNRIPSHEPWDQHESTDPSKFVPAKTDRSIGTTVSASSNLTAPTLVKTLPASVPVVNALPGKINASGISSGFLPSVTPGDYASLAASGQAGQAAIKKAAIQLGLTGKQALAALLGIAGGESQWQTVTESFNYKTADRLLEIFPSVFKGDRNLAQQYVGNPNNALPEFLYGYQTAKGKGLGNTQPGDGAAFVGRGFIQLTGRSNYTRYSHLLYDNKCFGSSGKPTTLIDTPTMLNDLNIAAQASVLYMLDRVKVSQTSDDYFQAALNAVGFNAPDILTKKTGLYQYFLTTLTSSDNGNVVTDSSGMPVLSGTIN
jgi:predicted chitinase